MEVKSNLSRRTFLIASARALAWFSALLGTAGLIRFLSFKPDPPPPKVFEIGPETGYPLNSRTALPDIPAVLIRTQDGLNALSLVCPHLSCTVEVLPDGFRCPCHGSLYDSQGGLLRGPSTASLKTLRVERSSEGNLVIYV